MKSIIGEAEKHHGNSWFSVPSVFSVANIFWELRFIYGDRSVCAHAEWGAAFWVIGGGLGEFFER